MRLLVLIFSILLFSATLSAKSEKNATVSPWLYKKLQKTEQLVSKKKYTLAIQKLNSTLPEIDKKSFEHASVLRSLSSVYALKGEYNKATDLLKQCVNMHVLPSEQEQQALLNLGQLYMATEKYQLAITTLESWLTTNQKPNTQINVLLANAYAQLKNYRKALPYIKKAIAQTKKPEESWYQLNLALYYELGEYSSATKLLTKLIRIYPDKATYWHQLSSTYQQLKQYKKATSIKHLAYKKGFIYKEKGIIELVNVFLYIHSPFKAANILQQEMKSKRVSGSSKNWELLANAWTMAKEFDLAIKALEKASSLNKKGSLYLQLGQIYVEQEKWQQAITALNNAVNKGGLKKNTGTAFLLRGMSHYELKHPKQAKQSFHKAKQYSKSKKSADQWLKYISDSEQTN